MKYGRPPPVASIETRTGNWDQFPERHVNAKTRAWKCDAALMRDVCLWAIVYQATEAAEQQQKQLVRSSLA